MGADDKKWYYRENNQNQGPLSTQDFQQKIRVGTITAKTHVWAKGMPAWVNASQVPEFNNALDTPPPAITKSTPITLDRSRSTHTQTGHPQREFASAETVDESSMLMELRPQEVDDRTGVIDSKSLKKAQREAAQAHRVADRAERKFLSKLPSRRGLFSTIFFAIVIGVGYVATQVKPSSLATFGPELRTWLDRLVSPLPTLEDVKPEDYSALMKVARIPLGKSGPHAFAVPSVTSLTRPIFYVVSNLPDGTNLRFYLHGEPGAILSPTGVDVQFPMSLSHSIAKSKPIHTIDGKDLPSGDYFVVITEDEEQPPTIKPIFDSLPASSEKMPSFIAKSVKLIASQHFFLGGSKDASYQTKLDQLHAKEKEGDSREIAEYQGWISKFQMSFAQYTSNEAKAEKASNPFLKKKIWSTFETTWKAPTRTFQENDSKFPQLARLGGDLVQQLQKGVELNRSRFIDVALIAGASSPSGASAASVPDQIKAIDQDLSAKIQDFQNKVQEKVKMLPPPAPGASAGTPPSVGAGK